MDVGRHYRYSEHMLPDCCLIAQKKEYQYRSQEDLRENQNPYMEDFLSKRSFGEIADSLLKGFRIVSTDSPNLISAYIVQVTCDKGHKTYLIVVGLRIYFLIWRLNLICSNLWKIGDGTIRGDLTNFPKEYHLNQLSDAIKLYLHGENLNKINLKEFYAILNDSEPEVLSTYSDIVEYAELFILFHEICHILPIPDDKRFKFDIENTFNISELRFSKWKKEIQTDIDAIFLLCTSATEINQARGIDLLDSKKIGFSTVFAAYSSFISAIELIEIINFGPYTMKEAAFDYKFRHHPPTAFRMTMTTKYIKEFALFNLGKENWIEIQKFLDSHNSAIVKLINKYLKND